MVVRTAQRVIPESDVDWACSAGEARRLLSVNDYDLVLADYLLEEDERGTSLLLESHRRRPTTALAMMSALPLETLEQVAEQELPMAAKILPKPFRAIDLCALLFEIRAGGPGGGDRRTS